MKILERVGKTRKIHVDRELAEESFLKMSHNLHVNLSISLHLIIISSGQPFNSYNVNHAAVTDEIHTCIQFRA